MFLGNGSIPNMLLPIIEQALAGKKEDTEEGGSLSIEEIAREAMGDPEKIAGMMEMQDNIIVQCVVAPVVAHIPLYTDEHNAAALCSAEMVGQQIPFGSPHREFGYAPEEGENPEGLPDLPIFVDEVDALDKQYIFNWCMGGTKDLERFRSGQADALDRVASVAEGGVTTE